MMSQTHSQSQAQWAQICARESKHGQQGVSPRPIHAEDWKLNITASAARRGGEQWKTNDQSVG
jgi:hypothetical protein